MTRLVKHVLLPAVAPLAIVGLYFTPVSLIGCANRGLAALGVVFVSLVTGIVVGSIAIARKYNLGEARWWWTSTILLLMLPAILVFGPMR